MNAIQIVGNTLQLTAANKFVVIIVAAMFAMLCVYKLITSERWVSMLAGVLLLVGVFVMLAGCVPADPRSAADAQERTTNASIAAQQSAARINQAQQADDEARRNAELLQSLQAQQAIVQGQAAIAQAQAQRDIAAGNNAALISVAGQMAAASKQDDTPLFIMLLVFMCMIPVVILLVFHLQRGAAAHQTPAPPVQHVYVHQLPTYGPRTMIDMLDDGIPGAVRQAAQQRGGVPMYDHDQARWLIVDPRDSSCVLATQRKQLTSKG